MEDGEAGPSKKPRTGVQACFLICAVLHPVDQSAVYPCLGSYSSCMQKGHLGLP